MYIGEYVYRAPIICSITITCTKNPKLYS